MPMIGIAITQEIPKYPLGEEAEPTPLLDEDLNPIQDEDGNVIYAN